MMRSALDTVTLYIEKIWNEGRDELIAELCADPIVRHDPNALTVLSHAEQKARIRHNYDELRPHFTWEVLAGDDSYVTLVWNVTGRDPAWALCGIEIFRVADGRITDVWNLPYVEGRWGQSKTLSIRSGGAPAEPVAILGIEVSGDAAKVRAPVDAVQIRRWLEPLLGKPSSRSLGGDRWEHVYDDGHAGSDNLAMMIAETDRPGMTLDGATATRIDLGLQPNGLVDATIHFSGRVSQSGDPIAPTPAAKVTRLSRTTGHFDRDGVRIGIVVDATIGFGAAGRDAAGRVTLRLSDGVTPDDAAGQGSLVLGWEEGGKTLSFDLPASLSATTTSFADGTGAEMGFAWTAPSLRARIVNRAPR